MQSRIIPAALTALLALGGAAAVSADVPITINVGVGQWFIDDDRQLDDTATPWISLEYAFGDHWAAEIFYAEDETEYDFGPDADIATWQLDALYYMGKPVGYGNQIRPYLAFGAGEIDIDAGSFDTVETTLNAGAGVRWMFTKRVGARMEARWLHSLDESHNDVLLTAGLNYYFGEVQPDVVPVAEVLDSDGDGVPDDRDQCPGTPVGTRVDHVGCPLPVAQVASVKLMVNFPFDSTVVGPQYFTDLGELAEFLKRFEDLQVDVEGHTDSVGPDDYNQQLSQRRAEAVVDLLVDKYGIDRRRLEAKGYGEGQPVATNDTEEGRAENRRVMATLEVEYEE